MPVFSIIIPVFNSATSLQKTIDSLLDQTFKDFEIVFVDGASTDSTLQIINDLQLDKTLNITAISESDKGIYDAMNKGIDLSTGEWIYFMGGDDTFYSRDVLAGIHKEIQKEPVDLIYGNVTGETSLTHYVYNTLSKVLSQGIHHQSIFYKRQVFDSVGKYNLFFKIAADYHLTLKVFVNINFKTRYLDFDVAKFGESGLSSSHFDYTFYSYHYKMLSENKALGKIDQPGKLLESSIYCCLFLAKQKKNVAYAWGNMWYYVTNGKGLTFKSRVKTFLQMLYWTIRTDGKLSAA